MCRKGKETKSKSSQHASNTLVVLLSKYRELFRLVFCAAGICCCYGFYGFLQEKIMSQSNLGATFILVLQTAVNIVVALLWSWLENLSSSTVNDDVTKRLNYPLLFLTSSIYVFAMAGSNEALRFVPYPTAVLAKSCKLIPTMIMGWAIEGRVYGLQQWASAVLISFGIAIFNISRIKEPPAISHAADKDEDQPSDEYWKGMVLLTISLSMDGFLGVAQGLLKRKDARGRSERPPTAVETMLWVNVYALLMLIPMAIVDNQMYAGIQLLYDDSFLLRSIMILNAVVGIGQIFIFLTITWYSSLVCTTITTTRKFFTILFSVIHFGHHFSYGQWVSICMVFGGLYLSIFPSKDHSKHDEHYASAKKSAVKQD